jgi:hypothetical protein
MKQPVFSSSPHVFKLLFALFVITVSFLVFMAMGVVFAIIVSGLSPVQLLSFLGNYSDPASIEILKYFQIVQSLALFVVPPFVLAWLFSSAPFEYISLSVRPRVSAIILTIIIIIASFPFVNFLAELNSHLKLPDFMASLERWMKNTESEAEKITDAFMNVSTTGGFTVNLIMIALIPAFGEELLFRGFFQKLFTGWTRSRHAGVFIAALLFSTLHLQFYGFLPRFLLGLFFGYLLVWSGSVWLPMLGHFINNATAVILSFLIHHGAVNAQAEDFGMSMDTWVYAGISMVLVSILVWWLFRKEKRVL